MPTFIVSSITLVAEPNNGICLAKDKTKVQILAMGFVTSMMLFLQSENGTTTCCYFLKDAMSDVKYMKTGFSTPAFTERFSRVGYLFGKASNSGASQSATTLLFGSPEGMNRVIFFGVTPKCFPFKVH